MSDIRDRMGRAAGTRGPVSSGFDRDSDTNALKALCAEGAKEIDRLRARLEKVEGGQPVAYRIADDLEAAEAPDADGGYMWDARECADWIRENAHAYKAPPAEVPGWLGPVSITVGGGTHWRRMQTYEI
jgi:hypothetical protein